jgi:hypothetical protein
MAALHAQIEPMKMSYKSHDETKKDHAESWLAPGII